MLSRLSGRAPRALQSLLTAPALRASSRQANVQLFSRFAGRSQGQQQRSFSSGASSSAAPHSSGSSSSFNLGVWGALGALVGTSLYYVYNEEDQTAHAAAGPVDYDKVRADIAELLDDNNYDDGSYGPVFVRLAWHASGTYDAKTGTGGSNGSTMRFDPESKWGANSGLAIARDRLEGVKKKHPNITYADLWTLAGAVAIEEMGGPKIAWRPGREDHVDGKKIVEDGRLPDATQGQDHLRKIFYRMGFNDQEIVALSGAHSLGRCHTDRSGFEGPWSRAPTTVSNEYFRLLLEEKWQVRDWKGPKQFENASDRTLMMLTSDLALIQDPAFRKWVELYAKDEDAWRRDFAAAFSRLMELGVPFK